MNLSLTCGGAQKVGSWWLSYIFAVLNSAYLQCKLVGILVFPLQLEFENGCSYLDQVLVLQLSLYSNLFSIHIGAVGAI